MKIEQNALAHHWVGTFRGGEKVLGEIRKIFPEAPLYTLFVRRGRVPDWIIGREVHTSMLQHVPKIERFYKVLLPFHAWAFRGISIAEGTGMVICSDASSAKGMSIPEGCKLVCYCHSPPRYLWDMCEEHARYGAKFGRVGPWAFKLVAAQARRFDFAAAQRVDYFIANSRFVADRIDRFYNRDAKVIYPPVEVSRFTPTLENDGSYLIVSQLVPYKRVDLAVSAFNELDRRLVVIGAGTEDRKLRKMAKKNIEFVGWQSEEALRGYMQRCRALIFPQVEDFGITAVEAQAAGKPVLALGRGGALEAVIDGETGLFFDQQSPLALIDTIRRFEKMGSPSWTERCRANAERFSPDVFRRTFQGFLNENGLGIDSSGNNAEAVVQSRCESRI
jgi:glycosyltransferase involved in cell wall biosynthesis